MNDVLYFAKSGVSCKVEWTSAKRQNLELVDYDAVENNNEVNWKFVTKAEYEAEKRKGY